MFKKLWISYKYKNIVKKMIEIEKIYGCLIVMLWIEI